MSAETPPKQQYDVQTMFQDLDIGKFIFGTSAVYITEQLFGHPFEVMRARLQVTRSSSNWTAVKETFKAGGGVKGLYAGFLPGTIGHIPGNAIYLTVYAYSKDRLQQYHNSLYPEDADGRQVLWVSCAAAAICDAAAITFYTPVDVVVQRLFVQEANNKRYQNAMDCCRSIIREEGLRGFYKGFWPVFLNSVPASAMWWMVYEESKTVLSKKWEDWYEKPQGDVSVVHKHIPAQLVAGGLAGATITLTTNPLDVVRTRLQTQQVSHATEQIHGALAMAKDVMRKEGVRGFFKGVMPRLTQYVIFSSLSAFLYESIVDWSTKK